MSAVSRVGGRGGDSFLSPDLQHEAIGRVAAVISSSLLVSEVR